MKFKQLFYYLVFLFLLLMQLPAWATDIFVPVAELKAAADNGDWAKAVLLYAVRIAGYLCYIIAVGGFFAVAGETIAAYKHAKQREQMGHFFSWAAIGLVLLAVIVGLIYGGNYLLGQFPTA